MIKSVLQMIEECENNLKIIAASGTSPNLHILEKGKLQGLQAALVQLQECEHVMDCLDEALELAGWENVQSAAYRKKYPREKDHEIT